MKSKLLSKNARYIFVCILIIGMLVFFFSSRSWLGDDRDVQNYQYGHTLTMNNSWSVKADNSVYDPNTKTLTINFYTKAKNSNGSISAEKPIVDYVTLGNSQGPRLNFDLSILPENTEYGQRLTIYNVEKDWFYIRVYISCKKFDKQKETSLDDFGNKIIYPLVEGKKDTTYVSIDYRITKWLPIIEPSSLSDSTNITEVSVNE